MLKIIFSTLVITLIYSVNATEISQVNAPKVPLIQIGNGRYYIDRLTRLNWWGAFSHCRSLGLHLASLETEEENTAVISYLTANGGMDEFWLSGSDDSSDRIYVWTSTGAEFVYGYWHNGEPNNGVEEDCVGFFFQDGLFKWNDEECRATKGILCELICDANCTIP